MEVVTVLLCRGRTATGSNGFCETMVTWAAARRLYRAERSAVASASEKAASLSVKTGRTFGVYCLLSAGWRPVPACDIVAIVENKRTGGKIYNRL